MASPNPMKVLIMLTDVEPGSYVVRALLPTGEVVSAQAAVAPGRSEPVELVPRSPSPRESLAWAYYLRGTGRTKGDAAGPELSP